MELILTNRKPYTRQAAERIARAGANKMEAQGYTWKRYGYSGDTFIVTKATGEEYSLILSDGGNESEIMSCSCAFSNEGFNQHTCKHARFVMDGVKAEAAHDEDFYGRLAEEAAAKVGAGYWDKYLPPFGDPNLCKEFAQPVY